MYCRNCGRELPDEARFCDACGTAQAAAQTESFLSQEGNNKVSVVPTVPLLSQEENVITSYSPTAFPLTPKDSGTSATRKESIRALLRRYRLLLMIGGAFLAVLLFMGGAYWLLHAKTPAAAQPPTLEELLKDAERLIGEGKYEEAILKYEAAVKIEPKNEAIYLGWAGAYEALGDEPSAIRVLSDGYVLLESATLETKLSNYLDIVEIKRLLAVQYGEDLAVRVQQIDVSAFPSIRIYVDVRDASGNTPTDLEPGFFYLSERISENGGYVRRAVEHVTQLDGAERININLVADISGSMDGDPIYRAKRIMANFLETMQFQVGDKAALIAFSDDLTVRSSFTGDKMELAGHIDSLLSNGGSTALYDALLSAIYATVPQDGAKAIIAFTDGMDNASAYSVDEVARIADTYKIPIFIIGIGTDVETSDLTHIAETSGGFYRNVAQVDQGMQEIYQTIFAQEKEQYLLEYTAATDDTATGFRDIVVDIGSRLYMGTSPSFVYEPQAHYSYFNGLLLPNGEWDPELFILEMDKLLILPSELDQYSQEQVAYIRNGLYALSGKVFKKDKFRTYFQSKSWYVPYTNYVESDPVIVQRFNAFQKANWDVIIAYEKVRGWR